MKSYSKNKFLIGLAAVALSHSMSVAHAKVDCSDLTEHFQVLGLQKVTSMREVNKAARKLAMEFHPDKNTGTDTTKKMAEINNAREMLEQCKNSPSFFKSYPSKNMHSYGGDFVEGGINVVSNLVKTAWSWINRHF